MINASASDLPVLVGIDDSPASLQALRVGADEAALRHSRVRVLHVWHMPSSWSAPGPQSHDRAAEYFRQRITEEVSQMQADRVAAGRSPVAVTVDVIEGDPIRELLSVAATSSLLVIGVDTHRGPSDILTSVGEGCATHPPCPVLIVPGPTGGTS